jgi:LTXXQ motif family protein
MPHSKMSQFALSTFASLVAALVVALVGNELQGPQVTLPRLCQDAPALFAGWTAFTQERMRLRHDQQPAWQNFVQSARGAVEPIMQVCHRAQANPEPADLPEQLVLQETLASARLDALHTLTPAVAQLWPELSPAQRQLLHLPLMGARLMPLSAPPATPGLK